MTPAASPREAAESAEIVIVMVTNTPSCEAVMEGPDGVLAGLRPGTLVVDMGTTQVSATRRIAAAVEAKGCDYVDAPVSGGEVGAVEASLTIMRSEEHTSELQSLMRISYAVFCLKKKKNRKANKNMKYGSI